MKNDYASLCLLAYQRPEYLVHTLNSLLNTNPGYKYELIVNDDGSGEQVKDFLYQLLKQGKITNLVLNGGKNRGIGKSLKNCLGITSGDYIFKLDADLTYREGWLKKSVEILKNNKDIGAVSLFNYRHYAPTDERFNILEERPDCYIVDDLVSSIYGFRRELYKKYGREQTLASWTDGWHLNLKKKGYKLAITKEDYVENYGFGLGKSVFVNPDGTIHEFHSEPLLLGGEYE
jgi:glycosyltransferase involved in cell wall biosynthesis